MTLRDLLHVGVGSAVIAFATSTSAAAMTATADVEPQATSVEQIIVTAQRRAESLQDVPVAVTALTPQALQAEQIHDVLGLQRVTPSLNIAKFPGDNLTATVTLRGLGVSDILPTIDPAVGIYLDGVYLGRSTGANLNLLDLERVEVLRGPQGTLFGRNTIGGAISIVTAKPKDAFEGSLGADLGNYDTVRLQGMVNLPLSDGLAARLVASHSEHSGFANSSITGAPLSAENTDYGRVQVAYDLAPRWNLLVSGDYTHAHTQGGQLAVARKLFGASATLINLVSGGLDSASNYVASGTPSEVPSTTNGHYNATIWGAGTTLTGELGAATFKAILGYRDLDRVVADNDLDGTPYVISEQNPLRDTQRQVSAEVQLYGKSLSDRLNWIVGAYYFHERGLDFVQSRALFPLSQTQSVVDAVATNESASVFGQATYAVVDNVRLTAGVRYVHDDRGLDSHNRNLTSAGALASCGITGATPPSCEVSPPTAKFNYAPFTLGVDYRPWSDVLLYAKFSRGFRSGGFNARATTAGALTPFGPEHIDAAELGAKTEFFAHRLRLNLSAYSSKYQNMQLSAFIPSSTGAPVATITNAGRVQIDGLEFEATAVLQRLTLSAAAGYTDAHFKELAPTVTTATLQSKLPYVPKWNASVAADYRLPMSFGAVRAHVDYNYRDKVFFAPVPPADPANVQKAYGLMNASLALDFGEKTTLTVYGANLTDKSYDLRRFNLGVIGAIIGFPGDPRTYGVRLDRRF
jgi:iron complex outermembrane receptor protein